jgi:hypothetical protein
MLGIEAVAEAKRPGKLVILDRLRLARQGQISATKEKHEKQGTGQ